MAMTETIAIMNKSGKLVSSSKHIVNLFKDAKDAYNEKKAELFADHRRKDKDRSSRALRDVRREEADYAHVNRSSERHRSGGDHKSREKDLPYRPALTERNVSLASEGSVTSSRSRSHHDDRASRSHKSSKSPKAYQAPFFENADISRSELVRRHTDYHSENGSQGKSTIRGYGPPQRAMTNPSLHDDIDMHLAYGEYSAPIPFRSPQPAEKERELHGLMSKMDRLMLEAHCVQHSVSSIIETLQKNPEAMAAVALTLAEISNLISHMSPGILTTIQGSSPAIFALLCSPQFLIAGGVAVGVTIVAFGGYKIIKKIQKDMAEKKEANRMDEAMTFDGDLNSIDTWRRGIADVEAQSVQTSVDGEYITPEAARIRKERIRERAKEERAFVAPSVTPSRSSTIKAPKEERRERASAAPSVAPSGSGTIKASKEERRERASVAPSLSRSGSGTIKAPKVASSRSVASESARSGSVARTESTMRPSKREATKEKKVKKPSTFKVLFNKSSKKSEASESRAGDDRLDLR